VRQGDKAENIYFITKGVAHVEILLEGIEKEEIEELKNEDKEFLAPKVVKILEAGSYFGEIALLTNLRRTATVVAEDFCNLATIKKDDFS
jgi:CPA2 family monovalent cation:H+ antiporter-2